MDLRYAVSPAEAKSFDTTQLRDHFLVESIFNADKLTITYILEDRYIVGGIMPISKQVKLEADKKDLGTDTFLERREIGIINIGGAGTIQVDGESHELDTKECLYVGLGKTEVLFSSKDASNPAKFYFLSAPAHKEYPVQKADLSQASPVHLGTPEAANERTIYKFIHPDGLKSCQLVMGMTMFKDGSLWNTMPAHTHMRRSEVYLYFDVPEDSVVFHFMGEPNETRHLVMRNEQVVYSPSWSIHSGAGTSSYTFIWGMAGENQSFDDMDFVAMKDLK